MTQFQWTWLIEWIWFDWVQKRRAKEGSKRLKGRKLAWIFAAMIRQGESGFLPRSFFSCHDQHLLSRFCFLSFMPSFPRPFFSYPLRFSFHSSFLFSFLPSFFPSFLPSFLLTFLPSFLPSYLSCFLFPFLLMFSPSLLPPFLLLFSSGSDKKFCCLQTKFLYPRLPKKSLQRYFFLQLNMYWSLWFV